MLSTRSPAPVRQMTTRMRRGTFLWLPALLLLLPPLLLLSTSSTMPEEKGEKRGMRWKDEIRKTEQVRFITDERELHNRVIQGILL